MGWFTEQIKQRTENDQSVLEVYNIYSVFLIIQENTDVGTNRQIIHLINR